MAKPKPATNIPTIEELTTIAFGVVHSPESGMYIPTRFELRNDEVVRESQCGPAGPYQPIAYQYAANAVMDLYGALALKAAQEQKT